MSVLPVSREDIEHELEAIKEEEANVNMKVRTTDTIIEEDEGIDEEETTPSIKKKEELFDIPVEEKPKKKKKTIKTSTIRQFKDGEGEVGGKTKGTQGGKRFRKAKINTTKKKS